jgi:hypothetical protein
VKRALSAALAALLLWLPGAAYRLGPPLGVGTAFYIALHPRAALAATPTFTRANTAKGPTTLNTPQTSIVPTYTAASAGGTLVAVVLLSTVSSCTGAITGPGGNWSQAGSTLANSSWNLCAAFFQNAAVDGSTSVTFTVSNGTPFAIVYEFGSTAGIDATHIFSATAATGASVGTGSGTAQEANDYQLIGGITGDNNFTANAVTGFTKDLDLADHGGGVSSFGASGAIYHANAVNSSTTIASQTITWTGTNQPALGFTVLMRPSVSAATFGVYPNAGAYPGGRP